MAEALPYLGIVICIFFSAFFSGSEIAFASVNTLRLKNAADNGSKAAKVAFFLCEQYDKALCTILIGNNLVNIASSSIATVIALDLVGSAGAVYATGVMTVLILIFGEIVPKILAKEHCDGFVLKTAAPLRFLMIVTKPLVTAITWLIDRISRLWGGDPEPEPITPDELMTIIETVEDEGVIDEDRSELLRSALDFSDISASEAMTARVDMVAIDIDDDWDEIVRIINDSSYSRLPVYSGSVDNIIGFLYLNRFFKAMMDGRPDDLRAQLIPPCFVYKTTRLPDVLAKLRREQKHLAVVTDEFGGTLGVITMEDVLEELVGDIWDETDVVENEVVARPDGGYELDGAMTLSDFLELLDWNEDALDDADSTTVGGWTLERFGTFPKPGDSFRYENLTVTVLAMDGRRVERVLVQPDPPEDRDE